MARAARDGASAAQLPFSGQDPAWTGTADPPAAPHRRPRGAARPQDHPAGRLPPPARSGPARPAARQLELDYAAAVTAIAAASPRPGGPDSRRASTSGPGRCEPDPDDAGWAEPPDFDFGSEPCAAWQDDPEPGGYWLDDEPDPIGDDQDVC